jgi:HSP20 family molecular chaperone IbpA
MRGMATKNVEDRMADSIQQAVADAAHPEVVPVNMYEADQAYVVITPLPGVMADDIEVKVDDGQLSIYAQMRSPAVKAYLIHEWHYGPYERIVDLPDDCSGAFDTSFGNGQLAVRLLKR